MKKLLWVGDAACASGFARSTHKILDAVRLEWDVAVLGLNYLGDPHEWPYPIFPAWPGGDLLGTKRLPTLVGSFKPDVVVIQNDPWNFPHYLKPLDRALEATKTARPKIVGFVAIDGENCYAKKYLAGVDKAIFWTKFAEDEAKFGGYEGPTAIVPLGVDTNLYCPGPRRQARINLGLPEKCLDAWIVGNINRNQPRKRLDLTIKYFAKWWHTVGRPDAYLFLHVAPTGDLNVDCEQLAAYYGVGERLILAEPAVYHNNPEALVVETLRSFNAILTTTQGEGFGLTTLEAMACGIPPVAPRFSALGEWARDGALLVKCSTSSLTPTVNVIGGVPDEDETVGALDVLYRDPVRYAMQVEKALACARQEQFDWGNIGMAFLEAVREYGTQGDRVG